MTPIGEIRVARIIARLNVGGPAIHVCNLTSGLPAPFMSRLFVGEVSPGEDEMSDFVEQTNVRPTRVPGLGRAVRPADAMALWHLTRQLREFRPHIVHTHTAKAGTLGRLAARALGVPVVVHTFHGHVLDGYFNPLVTRTFLNIERALGRVTDAIITLSPRQHSEITAKFRVAPPGKVHVVPLGFDFARFDNLSSLRGHLRRELRLGDSAPLVASVGRLTAIKDHPLLLEALRLAREDVHLVIVGGGEEEMRLRTLAAQLRLEHRVHFLGFRSDLERVLADIDVVALTSRNEGTPVALIEALAAGRLPVSTAVGGVEDVLEGGRWGRLVRSRNPRDFAMTLDAALSEARALSDAEISARKTYARERFGVFRLIQDHVALYRNLLEKKQFS
jgi:glycosyltransferase involved in cell wall biosynthesis